MKYGHMPHAMPANRPRFFQNGRVARREGRFAGESSVRMRTRAPPSEESSGGMNARTHRAGGETGRRVAGGAQLVRRLPCSHARQNGRRTTGGGEAETGKEAFPR